MFSNPKLKFSIQFSVRIYCCIKCDITVKSISFDVMRETNHCSFSNLWMCYKSTLNFCCT